MSAPRCDCSIIIPTRNRATILGHTLARLAELPQSRIETIVIDNGSSDQTLELEVEFPAVRWINLSQNLGCAARNVAAAAARGRVLLMLDDDSFPEPGVIEYLVQAMDENPGLGAIACRVLLNNSASPPQHDAGGVHGIFFNCGGAIRTEAFLECGGFPIDFEYYVEEYDLCCRLWKGGWHIEPHGDAIVWHARVTKNRDNDNMLRLLVRNNLALWHRYAPPALRDQLIEMTLERYRRVAIKENALRGYEQGIRQGQERISRMRVLTNPLNIQQFENLMGISKARELLGRWVRENAINRVAVWGRGKGCEQVLELGRERQLDLAAVYDRNVESHPWRGVPLCRQADFRREDADGLIVGTLSPGVAEDQLAELRHKFAGLPILNLAPWMSAADSAGAGRERPGIRRTKSQSNRPLAFS